jgi:FixJ family two-component response regulator
MRERASAAGVDLRTVEDGTIPPLRLDPLQIEVVVQNMVHNAIDAVAQTRSPGSVTVELARTDDGGVIVSVVDTGHGIAPGDAERLFEPLSTTKAQGMGMGLTISRAIVEAHGGRMWIEPAPGKGALLASAAGGATWMRGRRAVGRPGRRRCGGAGLARAAPRAARLPHRHVRVRGGSARGGDARLVRLRRRRPEDAGQSGLELAAELQARGIAMPVVIITAHGDVASARTAFRLNAVDFLESPSTTTRSSTRSKPAMRASANGSRRGGFGRPRPLPCRAFPREREIAELVAQGMRNPAIAGKLGISPRTVEVHKARIMDKLGARGLDELIRIMSAK